MASDDAAVRGEYFDYTDGETTMEAYMVRPSGDGVDRPAVVLGHDWSGLTAPTERLAHRYAALGYVCVALDAYGKGVRGDPLGDNTHLMAPLMGDRARLRRRLLAGFGAVARLRGVDAGRMAAVGYCFGGLLALDLARAGARGLRAVVSFHGGLQAPSAAGLRAVQIDARVLLLHGWSDPIVPQADVIAIAEELTDAGVDWQLHAYGHAQHAFTFEAARFPERGIVFDESADRRSWAAMRMHLADALGMVGTGDAAHCPQHDPLRS